MSRILDVEQCPHCKGALQKPTPRSCPHCGGSLQQRYTSMGCLTSAPKLFLVAASIAWAAYALVR
jgi:hypothetical protein